MPVRSELCAVLVLICAGAACSSADIDPDGAVDSGGAVDAASDSGAEDAAMDSAVRDSALGDSAATDSGTPDTGAGDTGGPGDSGAADTGAGDTGGTVTIFGTGEVVITEIMIDSTAVGDSAGEWFELHNPGAAPFELEGCVLSDDNGNTDVFPDPLSIAPGAYLSLAVTSAPGFAPDYDYSDSLRLSNDAPLWDKVSLRCRGILIDEVVYGDGVVWSWANGRAMSLDPAHLNAVDNNTAGSWCFATTEYNRLNPGNIDYGTPGAANPACP